MLANLPKDNKSFLTWLLHVASNTAGYYRRVSLQPQECRARLVSMTNQPVPRPSTTSVAFSQGKLFFFSTSWKYWRLPIWLKTLNPIGYTAKYRYRKSLDLVRNSETGMSQTQEIKSFSAKTVCNSINFWGGYKIQIQIFNCQISPGLIQPVNRVASTTFL